MAKILLVDDDISFRGALMATLEIAGHDITSAENGLEALEVLKENKFDLIISDIQMPKMNGVDLTKEVRKNSQIPIILITGFSQIFETKQAFEIGANDFIPKPFEREDIEEAIRRCIGSEEQAQATEEKEELLFCRIGLNEFIYGKQIRFPVYLKLSKNKYVKLAHTGEDISPQRIREFRDKGIRFLCLKTSDFKQYVGVGIKLLQAANKTKTINHEKKVNLLSSVGNILAEDVFQNGVDKASFKDSAIFLENAVSVLTDSNDAVLLLEALEEHTDFLLSHSLGVSLYSILIANALHWRMPTHKFTLATGGLFHDIGHKELPSEMLQSQRVGWNHETLKLYENHSERGVKILQELPFISDDVLEIVSQHHEACSGFGFPKKKRKQSIHPMARIIAVADSFCNRVIKHPSFKMFEAEEAIQDMISRESDNLDRQFVNALASIFNIKIPEKKSKFI